MTQPNRYIETFLEWYGHPDRKLSKLFQVMDAFNKAENTKTANAIRAMGFKVTLDYSSCHCILKIDTSR